MAVIKRNVPFCLALAVGLIVMPLALLGWDFSFIPGDLGDTRFNIYLLEHGYQFLSGKHEWYWNAPFMYPVQNVITLSDNLLGTVPFYSTFRILGFDIFSSFQLWVVTIFALNFAAGYWLFNWLFKNVYVAAIAAFIFAFSISLQSQMAHAQVFARFFIPLAFLFLFKFGKTFSPKHFFLAGLCLVAQFYCGIYLGMLTLLPFAAVAFIIAILRYKRLFESIKKPLWWAFISLATVVNVALLYKLMWPYYERSLVSLPASYESIFLTIPKVVSYFFAKNGSLLWESLENIATDIPSWYDHQLFPGIFVCFSLFAAAPLLIRFKANNRLEITLLLVIGVINLLCFIRIGDFTLYQYIYNIPGFQSLRSLTRIIGIDLLFFAVAVGIFVKFLIEKFPKKELLIFSVVLGFLVVDNFVFPSSTYRSSAAIARERVESLKEKMSHLLPGTIISYEPEEVDYGVFVQLDAMLATQALELKCINGYSATSPGTFTPYWFEPNAENRRHWLISEGLDPELPVVIK